MKDLLIVESESSITVNGQKYLLEEGDILIMEDWKSAIADAFAKAAPKVKETAAKALEKYGPQIKAAIQKHGKKAIEVIKQKGIDGLKELIKAGKGAMGGEGGAEGGLKKKTISKEEWLTQNGDKIIAALRQEGYDIPEFAQSL